MLLFTLISGSASAVEPETTIGYRVTIRPELYSNPDFNNDTESDSVFQVNQGVRLSAESQWDSVGIHASFQDVRIWGSEAVQSASKDALAGLYEGYFDLGSDKQYLRLGRQQVILHDEFLFAAANWNPYGRAFDAMTFHTQRGKKLSANIRAMIWNNGGVYASQCEDNLDTLDLDECEGFVPETENSYGDFVYLMDAEARVNDAVIAQPFLVVLDQNKTQDDLERDRLIISPGLRLTGSPTDGLNYTVQGIYQLGHASEEIDHAAWSASADLKYGTEKWGIASRYENNSGDGDAADGEDNDFEAFLGARHKFRGFGDVLGGVNSQDMSLGANFIPMKGLNLMFNYHNLRLSNPEGTWRNARLDDMGLTPDGNSDATLGSEFDAVVNYKPASGVNFKLGHSVFMPSGAGAEIVGEDAYQFSYLWMVAQK